MLDLGLPRVALRGPTQVLDLGGGRLVLDEGAIAEPYGGNKVRKLEWLLGAARAGGGDIVTVGPAGSHYLLATAIYGRRLGLRVHAVAWPQRDGAHARDNLRALSAHAEQVWPARSMAHAARVAARAWTTVRALAGYPPAAWGPGGSNGLGTLGWVEAGMEIASRQPARVWTASGTGGTAAGLRLGLALAGCPAEVVAVDVAGAGRAAIQLAGWRASRHLGKLPPLGPLRVIREASPYGFPVHLDGPVPLDPVYSAKAWAHFERDGGPGLFVATANRLPMEPLLQEALPELPRRLAALMVSW
ncbi:MAG: pyridoxal-phosphate dependent enzyme [Deltaproteobacteria bacterium]|nr:pyridoxal-phosphate dependent enzyme [Deltaproteobacteria bacterium]